jgi:hypothetical protein
MSSEQNDTVNGSGWRQKLKDHGKTVALGVAGVISAAFIPIWQIYFVETSDVMIEIAAISRIESTQYKVLLDTDELMLLAPYIPESLLFEFDNTGGKGDRIDYPTFTLAVLIGAYDKAKQDLKNISVTKANLLRRINTIDLFLDPTNTEYELTEFRLSQLKEWDLRNYIDDAEAEYYEQQVLAITRSYSTIKFENDQPKINTLALAFLLKDVKEDIFDVIQSSDIRLEGLRDNIRSIETQLDKLKYVQLNQYTYFKVDVVASNTGRISTSLRPLALMRVQISDDNYVDIRLMMEDYKEQGELQPSSTNIIHYRSGEIHSFPKEDQSLVNTFWGSTGRVRLFSLDTKHNVFTSNQIAFVDNLNQKVMIDKLKKVAALNMVGG